MGRLALGRAAVLRRTSLPYPSRPESGRVIPPEPDELWNAIALQIRNNTLIKSIEAAEQVRAVGLLQELRRNQRLLGTLLERIGVDAGSFEERALDTPAAVAATKLARLPLEERPDAAALDNPDDLVVSIQGRGFPFMAEFWVRGDFVNGEGALRSFPTQLTAQTSDLSSLEFSAGKPLSELGAAVGSIVTFTLIVELRSNRFVTRAFDRFTVV